MNQMKEKITQMSEIITLLCEKRSVNEDDVACDKIRKIVESIEKSDIKKVTERKKTLTKLLEVAQGKNMIQ